MVILVQICIKYQQVSELVFPWLSLWLDQVKISKKSLLSGASTDNLPPGVLYKVKATYKYQAEDMDELSFEVGELIDVIEYDDPEEQVSARGWWGISRDWPGVWCFRRKAGWWERRTPLDRRVYSQQTSPNPSRNLTQSDISFIVLATRSEKFCSSIFRCSNIWYENITLKKHLTHI